MPEPKFRPMTKYEEAVLKRLLELPFAGRDEVARQAEHALVREIAGPGDHHGSVEFKVASEVRAPHRWTVPVEAVGRDSDGVEIDFLLHLKDGFLDAIEVLRVDASKVKRLPDPESLEVSLLTYGNAAS